ncbi:MAG TPA: energy-coupling factor ABC transporter ATP-binding protein [Candidatus Mediterraneibacter intestinavium]|nr:energy-coupling factor ABC transporter ATP-binding protein [Candidatus Mediterraneibacter intestinavium]
MEYNRMKQEKEWVIEAQNISYTYEENEKPALEGMSLKIRRGSKVAFMGGNGSGKSTFFLCLNGIRKPDEGRVLIDGEPVSYTRKGLLDVRRRVGIVFQEPDDQLFSASVYQEISFGILNLGVGEEKARKEVERVIRELGILPFQDRPAHALSGGQKKLVAIADILVMDPEVMILDEPASSLDPKHTKIVRGIVEGLTERGITVLMATHDMDHAFGWADEIVLMHEGRVLKSGIPLEVCSDRGALEKANLEVPAVLRLYEKMREKGMVSPEGGIPRTMEELERRLV